MPQQLHRSAHDSRMCELCRIPDSSVSQMPRHLPGQRPRGLLNLAPTRGQAESEIPRLQPAVIAPGLVQFAPTGAFALAAYTTSAAETIVAWKERGNPRAQAQMLAAFTALYAEAILVWGFLDVVPVPSSRAADLRRGGASLADTVCQAMARVGVDAQHLHQPLVRRGARDQVGLGLATRMSNASWSFTVRSGARPPANAVVVVDDVITSGATVVTCSHLLASLGWQIGALVAPFARELVDCGTSQS